MQGNIEQDVTGKIDYSNIKLSAKSEALEAKLEKEKPWLCLPYVISAFLRRWPAFLFTVFFCTLTRQPTDFFIILSLITFLLDLCCITIAKIPLDMRMGVREILWHLENKTPVKDDVLFLSQALCKKIFLTEAAIITITALIFYYFNPSSV